MCPGFFPALQAPLLPPSSYRTQKRSKENVSVPRKSAAITGTRHRFGSSLAESILKSPSAGRKRKAAALKSQNPEVSNMNSCLRPSDRPRHVSRDEPAGRVERLPGCFTPRG